MCDGEIGGTNFHLMTSYVMWIHTDRLKTLAFIYCWEEKSPTSMSTCSWDLTPTDMNSGFDTEDLWELPLRLRKDVMPVMCCPCSTSPCE